MKNTPNVQVTGDRAHDPRITRVGKFIRKHGIDELPQFWNIIKGDMSLVGPRPWIPKEVNEMKPEQMLRYGNKPGLAMVCYSYSKAIPKHLKSTLMKNREFTHDENIEIEQDFYKNWNWKKEPKALFYFLRDLVIGRHI